MQVRQDAARAVSPLNKRHVDTLEHKMVHLEETNEDLWVKLKDSKHEIKWHTLEDQWDNIEDIKNSCNWNNLWVVEFPEATESSELQCLYKRKPLDALGLKKISR